jgi:septal ring factor EnvC (AmiA/AmiB activator)
MSTITEDKAILKKEKSKLEKEISSLKKVMSDYKVERKANWKTFKNKMNDDIEKIEKSIGKLTNHKKK